MTESRPILSGGVGLFATRDYVIGDFIVEEEKPTLRLAPASDEETATLLVALPAVRKGGKKDDDILAFTSSIAPPSNMNQNMVGKFLGMIQSLACYTELQQNEEALSKILDLYAPENPCPEEEESIVKVSQEALKYVQNHSKGGSKLRLFVSDHPDKAVKLMLVWSCNAFQGGRIYETQSRINHSCNPNAIIQAENERQVVRAVIDIASGEEITISYLGLLLYGDRETRQSQLALSKHFICQCLRCTSLLDPAAAIPCPSCHPREGRYLDEDVAFDDEKDVNYVFPRTSGKKQCLKCKETFDSTDDTQPLIASVTQKVAAHLLDKETSKSNDEEEDEEWEDQLHQMSLQVVGTLHWTTNIISFLRLNRQLKHHHAAMLQTGENPDEEAIAEAIDSLERLCRFSDCLSLDMHMGHLLSNVVVGVARTLVSLGDDKSKAYGAKWVNKILDYTNTFESAGIQKVVQTLLRAGDRTSDEPPSKKKRN